jgi:hypothetical protein
MNELERAVVIRAGVFDTRGKGQPSRGMLPGVSHFIDRRRLKRDQGSKLK